jgi:hypothetical protein
MNALQLPFATVVLAAILRDAAKRPLLRMRKTTAARIKKAA